MNLKEKTNLEVINDFMEKSPLHQLLVIQALCNYSRIVLDHKEKLLQNEKAFINPNAWIGVAREWGKIAEEKYDFQCEAKSNNG